MSNIKLKDYVVFKDELLKFGYILVDETYNGDQQSYNLIDLEGYKYKSVMATLRKGSVPRKVSKHNPYAIENIKLWCKKNNKDFVIKSDEFIDVGAKLNWLCIKENCGEEFDTSWRSLYLNGTGCPFCSGQRVSSSNCLNKRFPLVASEWHPVKNGILTPHDVTPGTGKKVWWKCNNNHEWEAKVQNRTINKTGCPYCSGRFASIEYNLLITNPELCKEWDYKKNKKDPSSYVAGTHAKVHWICQKGHEWEAAIANRNGLGRGCPFCNESKGERKIRGFLDKEEIKYESQKEFSDLRGLGGGFLSYDFYLPNHNLLIEYQGQFHDGSTGAYSRINLATQKEHDRRKRLFAKKEGINLLEIWYYDFEKIEEIISLNI